MTTIIIHQPTMRVIADKCLTESGGGRPKKSLVARKIHKGADCVLVGTGSKNDIDEFIDNYLHGHVLSTPSNPDTCTYVISQKGDGLQVRKYLVVKGFWKCRWELSSEYILKQGDYTCAGSGWQIAAGALEAGATPQQAIKITGELDTYTSCECDVWDFRKGAFV